MGAFLERPEKNYTPSTTKSQTPHPKTKTDAGSAAPASNQNNIPTPASSDRVVGMRFIPPGDQIVAGFANVLGVDDVSPKRVRLIHRLINTLVRPGFAFGYPLPCPEKDCACLYYQGLHRPATAET